MIPDYVTHERLAQAHQQQLLHEAAHERLCTQLITPGYRLWFTNVVQLFQRFRLKLQKNLLRRTA